jgi:hypothetical protein
MNLLRTFLVLLLCAMLPLSGLAATGLTGACPMQPAIADSSHAMPVGMSGCDSMSPSSGEQDKTKVSLCKVTAQCQMGSLYHPVSAPSIVRPAGLFFSPSFQYAASLSIREPDGPWRPPRSL